MAAGSRDVGRIPRGYPALSESNDECAILVPLEARSGCSLQAYSGATPGCRGPDGRGGVVIGMTRRQFVLASALAASRVQASRSTPIVDTHQHLWDLKRLSLPWLPTSGPLAGDHRLEDYIREADGLGITRTLYMEVDVAPEQHEAEAAYALERCGAPGSPMIGAILGGRPDSPDFEAYVTRFRRELRVRGLRQVLHSAATPQGHCLQPAYIAGIRLLGRMRLVFDICLPAPFLDDARQLADACPDTRFVLDHCGNPNVQEGPADSWRRAIDAVARRKNVACKISGIVATARRGAWAAEDLAPFIEHCRAAFGPDRILFGSDWPVCTMVASLREWVTALQRIVAGWPDDERRKLFSQNAVRWYGLSRLLSGSAA